MATNSEPAKDDVQIAVGEYSVAAIVFRLATFRTEE